MLTMTEEKEETNKMDTSDLVQEKKMGTSDLVRENETPTLDIDETKEEESELDRLAMEELLKEAKRGAERAKDMGAVGWLKSPVPPANKRFLNNTVMSAVKLNQPVSRNRPTEGNNLETIQEILGHGHATKSGKYDRKTDDDNHTDRSSKLSSYHRDSGVRRKHSHLTGGVHENDHKHKSHRKHSDKSHRKEKDDGDNTDAKTHRHRRKKSHKKSTKKDADRK